MIIYLLIYATSTVYAVLGDIELTQTTSVCVGDGNVLNATCPTGSIIAVSRFYYGFWNRTCNKTDDECCVYQEGDCLQMEQNVTDILEELSGKKQMTISDRDALAGESCQNQTKETISKYNQLDYLCINETRMWAVNENVSAEGDPGGPIYLHNRDYPNPVPDQDQANYTCSVEATTMTTLTLFGLHVDLKCDQTIDIRDGDSNPLLTLNCASAQSGLEKNFNTTYIKLTFTNDVSQSGGKFWLGFTAADAGTRLKLRCPAVTKELFKECDELHPPQNGNLTLTRTTHQSTANYFCFENYNLTSGDATRTCQANGSWSGTEPVCSPAIDCGKPESPSNGTVNVSATTYSSVATYACSKYYNLTSGNSSRTCLANGSWSGEKPVCSLAVECILNDQCNKSQHVCDGEKHKCIYICNNPSIDNGDANVDMVRPVVSSTVTYTCDEGYSLSGALTRTCQETKGWSGEQPKCVKICNDLPIIDNGKVIIDDTSRVVGSIATYTCNQGYTLSGGKTRTCQETSRWSEEQPLCVKICEDLPSIDNGMVSINEKRRVVNSIVKYKCNKGYSISGNATRVCQETTSWSGQQPSCVKLCVDLQSINNGNVSIDNDTRFVGSTVTYTCNPGYILSGDVQRSCNENAEWSGKQPSCLKLCKVLQNITHGSVITDDKRQVVGTIATYTCKNGYSLYGDQTRTCQEPTGWSGKLPACVKKCDHPKAPENGNISLIGSGSTGTVAIFTCNTGYSIHGPQRLDCREDSTWSDEQPECLLTEKSVQTQSDQTGLAVTIPIILILLAALILFILYHKGLCKKHEILVEEGRPTDEETKKDIASQRMSNLISKENNQAKDISTASDAVDKKCPIASAEGVDLDHVYDNPEGETAKKDEKDQANANKESEQESNKKQADNASTYENVSDTKREDADKPGMSPSEGQNKAEVPVPTENAATKRSSQVIESSGNPDAKGNDVPIESGGPDTKSAAHTVEGVDGSKGDTVQTGSTEKPLIEFDTDDKKNSKEESTAKEETNAADGVQNTNEGDVKIDKDN